MKLLEYLDTNGISVRNFAEQIGAKTRVNVYRYINGVNIPAPEVMTKIHAITGGAVTANDFYDLSSDGHKSNSSIKKPRDN